MSKAEQHWLMPQVMSVQAGATVDFVELATALPSWGNGKILPYLA